MDSYVFLLKGEAKLNSDILNINKRYKLRIWDILSTWKDSLAVLEWWDWSVTRIWWNSSLEVQELFISRDLSKMNVSIKLIRWRTWSNIISLFADWSYFKETFRDTEAAVRWTVFDLDLDKDYLYVITHKVQLTKRNWEIVIVNEKNPFNIRDFKFIWLDNFIKYFKDKDWEKLNIDFDNAFLQLMKNKLNKEIKNFNKLKDIDIQKVLWDDFKKQELYHKLFKEYQKLNFIKSEEQDLFKLKLELKDKLLSLANKENKNILINSTLNDFNEVIDSKNYTNIDIILWILSKNINYLNSINLKEYFNDKIVPEDIKIKIQQKFSDLNEFINSLSNVKVGLDDIKNINDKASEVIQEWLNTLFDK